MNISVLSWQELKVKVQFIRALEEEGLKSPTPIQEKCILPVLAGQKVIGIAPTGTGKTAAYVLPLISRLVFAEGLNPRVLVLAPTKELVIQIANQFRLFSKYSDLRTLDLFGGVGLKMQLEGLKRGSDIIVSTPGRFLEIYLKNGLSTKLIKTLVIDEADRMMDLNFMPQLRSILEILPTKRQNLLFSATFPPRVERMASEFIENPYKVEINPQSTVTSQVTQLMYQVPNFRTKVNFLSYLLAKPELGRVIIFARTKETVINLGKYLSRTMPDKVAIVHSNKSQNSRINALKQFNDGMLSVLVSTDVSARGIDFKYVSHVINFDVPLMYEDYVHRIGRTGRALETGSAITFATPIDLYHISKIEKLINEKISKKSIPDIIAIEETPFTEAQQMARELDRQRKILDPTFKGAFHQKKH